MIVLGLNYGDEGKGLTTSFLCSKTENPIVVRFNGGQQAGHTVVYKDHRHIFSGFGSGSLQGIPTYWSSYCTFHPCSFLREHELLFDPVIFIHPLCPVTTPFDIDFNRKTDKKAAHGTVGMGFGATIARQEAHYKLFVQDLFHVTVLRAKLHSIAAFYGVSNPEEEIGKFIASVKKVRNIIRIADDSILQRYTPIFEGAQGILLDMDFGFFPNVTRSNTTSKNALQLYNSKEVYYVTRSYLTRHGNGFLPNEEKLHLKNNENETNQTNEFQGAFRTAKLNTELMNYALECDNHFSEGLKRNLVITCNDQYPIDIDKLLVKLNVPFDNVFCSYGDSLNDVELWKSVL